MCLSSNFARISQTRAEPRSMKARRLWERRKEGNGVKNKSSGAENCEYLFFFFFLGGENCLGSFVFVRYSINLHLSLSLSLSLSLHAASLSLSFSPTPPHTPSLSLSEWNCRSWAQGGHKISSQWTQPMCNRLLTKFVAGAAEVRLTRLELWSITENT